MRKQSFNNSIQIIMTIIICIYTFIPLATNAQCKASFSIINDSTVCTTSASRSFFDSSFIFNTSDTIIKEIWCHGDGIFDTVTNNFSAIRTHKYIKGGILTDTLFIFTQNGCTSSSNITIHLYINPIANFSYFQDTICTVPSTVQFVNSTQILNSSSSPYKWIIDGQNYLFDTNPSYTFNTVGYHNISLVAKNRNNCSDTLTRIIGIAGKPKSNILWEAKSVGSKTVIFNDASSEAYVPLAKYYWDFGDGNISYEANPIHTYTTFDSFLVSHYVQSSFNCISDTIFTRIYVDSVSLAVSEFQSNSGNEFWTGFGYEEKMNKQSRNASVAKMSIYIASGKNPTKVIISLPGIPRANGFPKRVLIPADSIVEISDFPEGDSTDIYNKGGYPDSRLYYTGISNRGIHITSDNPISLWQHIYANNTTGGSSLLLPTKIWGNDYFVQSMGGISNYSNPNSFFFVVANEDSTEIEFTPTNDIVDSSGTTIFTQTHTSSDVKYHSGFSYRVSLNKGQIFNCMGFISFSASSDTYVGDDLSGTRIRTLNPFKKIAVFGGNGRVMLNTAGCIATSTWTGSDNMIQQIFPKTVWGTRYLTAPTKTMEYNIFRITVSDTTTQVKVNGIPISKSSLIKNSFYQYETNKPSLFESDKRVMLTQYIISNGTGNSNTCPNYTLGCNGDGDPEMIILSPLKYSIKNARAYSIIFRNQIPVAARANYVNVIIKKNGVNSFNMNGVSLVDTGTNSFVNSSPFGSSNLIPIIQAFKPHPADSNYYYAKFKVPTGTIQHLSSDSAFVAIAYGLGGQESNGYNVGFDFNAPKHRYEYFGIGKWTEVDKWVGNNIPPTTLPMGDEIIISGNCTLENSQVIEDGASLIVLSSGNLTVNGNLITQQ